MLGPKITADLSSLSERNKIIVDLWNANDVRSFWFIVGDDIQERQGQATQLGSGWDNELELTISTIVPWRGVMYDPYAEQPLERELFKDVFLTEREAVERILPTLEMKASWINGIIAGYKTRLKGLS